jgi:hypothetical protein
LTIIDLPSPVISGVTSVNPSCFGVWTFPKKW